MTLDEYARHDAFGLAELVRRRETTPGELARLAAEAVTRLNPAINAVIEVFDDVVDDPASSGMNPDGPLYGVPFMIKDIASKAAGRVQSAGMEAWADTIDDEDDPLVANARDAGLNVMGRTTCSEGGVTFQTWTRRFGVTRNPWNLDHTSGGSSGGSAAAVAARIAPIMGANDGGGSTRCPASWNGLVGLKPSRGLLPMPRGLSEATMANGVEGILTRTLRDHAVAYDVLCRKKPGMGFMAYPEPRQSFLADLYDTPARRFRIALALGPWGGLPPHPDLVAATEATATLLQDMGHQVDEVRDEEICDFAALRESFLVWNWLPRRIHSVMAFARSRAVTLDSSTLSPVGLRHLEAAGRYDQEDIFRAQVMNDTVTRQWGRFFEGFDLILAPAVSILCPLAEDVSYSVFSEAPLDEWINHLLDSVPYTLAGNATGTPAMALPAGLDSNGLPLGVQIYAPWGAEGRLFHISGQIERARPEMFDQVAPLNAGASGASIAAVA